MDKKTFVITTDQNSDYDACMSPILCKYDYIQFRSPESVIVMNGHEKLYDEDALDRARRAGEDAAWDLAQRIMRRYECGGYTIADLRQAFDVTEVVPDRDVAGVCILMKDFATASSSLKKVEEKKAKEFRTGDVVTLTWRSRVHKAVVTTVLHDMLSVVFDTGDIDNVGKNRCTKTGKTLGIAAMLVELNGEEE